jgi:uncharacterized damage-inducible protein DinB
MITPAYVQLMAEYNQWMNDKLYACAAQLSGEQLTEDRGAFFKSVHGTLKHIIWADDLWLSRFLGTSDKVVASNLDGMDLAAMTRHRVALDAAVVQWAKSVDESWLDQPLTWFSNLYKQTFAMSGWSAVTHFFNHQTHHRGQATTLLMQFGIDPGVTDLVFMNATRQSN